jgi:2,4-dienoyl-CoA reductase-like NADH-dependent reductase (Old Yellow Enzyme family)
VPGLFDPFTLRGVTLPNRIGVSPMCEYSSEDGFANDWHVVHLGSRAVGGAGLVMTEATSVEARGRITPADLGIWKDAHVEKLAHLVRVIESHGAVPGMQVAHAGRKASCDVPWAGGRGLSPSAGGWEPIAPSAIAFSGETVLPRAMSEGDIRTVQEAFVAGTQRALKAGFRWLELHFAHGYLAHTFLSPLSNARTDQYGGEFDNRVRFALETARAVRAVWPEQLPLGARLSCTDWAEGGWTAEDSVRLSRLLKAEGVDLVDCSSGGLVSTARIPLGPGYQVPFARQIRAETGVPTAAVGMITEPAQADGIVSSGEADLVFLAREMLRDPYWPLPCSKGTGAARAAAHSQPIPARLLDEAAARATGARTAVQTVRGVVTSPRASRSAEAPWRFRCGGSWRGPRRCRWRQWGGTGHSQPRRASSGRRPPR